MASMEFVLTLAAKGVVVLVMAAVASALFARASAALRHLAWSAGLVGLLLLPVLGFILPEVPVVRWQPTTPVSMAPVLAGPAAAPTGSGPVIAGADLPSAETPVATAAPIPVMEPPTAQAYVVEPPTNLAPDWAAPSFSLSPTTSPTIRLLQIWAIGSAVLLLWLVLGHARAARLARRASRDLSPEWDELIDEAAALAGLTIPAEVRESPDLTVPATVGILHPVVLVPAAGVEWSFSHRRDVLIHEFAHVLRRDCLTHSVGWIACALYWMNPLAWVALWRTRVEREHACDDIVLRAGARPSEYAEELLQTAHLARVPFATGAASLAMARRSQLSTRLLAILDAGRRRNPISTGAAAALGFGAAVVVLPVAALSPAAATIAENPAPIVAYVDETGPVPVTPFAVASNPVGAAFDEAASASTTPLAMMPGPIMTGSIGAQQSQGQTLCATSSTGRNRKVNVSRSMSFSGSGTGEDGDGNSYVVWSGLDCSVVIHVTGLVRFNAEENDVAGFTRSGRFEVTHTVGDRERRYLVRSRNGELERSYFIDDRPAELDAEAQRWRGIVVLEYIRRSGHDAEDRTRRILQRAGIDGVLAEIDEIGSDWAQSKYFMALLASSRLDDAAAAKVIGSAGRRIESDHYLAQILGAVPGSALNGSQARAAYLTASDGIESDHYVTQTLTRILASGSLEPAATRSLLQRASRMESDHYLATLLGGLVKTGTVRGELLADYLTAAKQIESDHYKAQVLGQLVPEFAGEPELLAAALTAAQTIESDHYLGEYLKQVLLAKALDGSAIEPFFAAVRTIESDHYRAGVLIAALGRSSAPIVVTRTLEAAPEIESDHYLAEVLVAAKRLGLTAEQQALLKKAADSIESDHYLGKVLR
ncbi:MAG TPA: M56 family metallopeptidase [Gemmatimonadales bacterium]